jgi:hypothetical protein
MDRAQAEAMMFAIRAAIIEARPMSDDGTLVVDLDAALSALAYIIAAIGVQAKFADTPAKTKAFIKLVADAVERDVGGLRACGGEPFCPGSTILRTDRRH